MADQEVLFNVKVIVPIKVTVDDGGPSLIPTQGEWFILPLLLWEGSSRLVTCLLYLSSSGDKEAFQPNVFG